MDDDDDDMAGRPTSRGEADQNRDWFTLYLNAFDVGWLDIQSQIWNRDRVLTHPHLSTLLTYSCSYICTCTCMYISNRHTCIHTYMGVWAQVSPELARSPIEMKRSRQEDKTLNYLCEIASSRANTRVTSVCIDNIFDSSWCIMYCTYNNIFTFCRQRTPKSCLVSVTVDTKSYRRNLCTGTSGYASSVFRYTVT